MHNSLAIVENIVEFRPAVYREACYNIICTFYAFLSAQRGGRRCAQQPGYCGEHCGVPASCVQEGFYTIICPFYAFLYTQRGGRWCAQQPGHCREHCGVPASSMQRRGTGRPSGLAGQKAEGEGPLRRQQALCERDPLHPSSERTREQVRTIQYLSDLRHKKTH